MLPRTGPDHFWKLIHKHYAKEDQQKWKELAMLALRENAGWPLEQIGAVFGHSKGHVTRCLEKIKCELREEFEMSPNYLGLDAEQDNGICNGASTENLSCQYKQLSEICSSEIEVVSAG